VVHTILVQKNGWATCHTVFYRVLKGRPDLDPHLDAEKGQSRLQLKLPPLIAVSEENSAAGAVVKNLWLDLDPDADSDELGHPPRRRKLMNFEEHHSSHT
jgi:hypothetical protein